MDEIRKYEILKDGNNTLLTDEEQLDGGVYLKFKTEVFEGPLDVLLHLVTKHKLDVVDIEIHILLEQYLDFIEQVSLENDDIPSEFLAMAARLIYIKTLSLLPKNEELVTLKKELENALYLYQIFKTAGETLLESCVFDKIFYRERKKIVTEPEYKCTHDKKELVKAYLDMLGKKGRKLPPKKELFSALVSAEYVSVSSKIIYVLRKLYTSGKVEYYDFFYSQEKSAKVATFLALLELIKSKRIEVSEDNKYILFIGGERQIAKL